MILKRSRLIQIQGGKGNLTSRLFMALNISMAWKKWVFIGPLENKYILLEYVIISKQTIADYHTQEIQVERLEKSLFAVIFTMEKNQSMYVQTIDSSRV